MSDDSLQIFAQEAEDLLEVAEQALLNMGDLSDVDGSIGELFRTFHTIKGAAGLFGLDSIVDFTHVVESLLGKIREGIINVDEDMISLFLASRDHLEKLVENALSDAESLDASLKKVDDELLAKFYIYLGKPDSNIEQSSNETATSTVTNENSLNIESENWHISLRFGPNALRNGMDPSSFIGYLSKIGEVINLALVTDAIPEWNSFDPESCYLGFEIELNAPNTNKEEIEYVFEFVVDDCKICILPPNSHIDLYINLIKELPEEDMRIGEILIACGALTPSEKDIVLNTQDRIADEIISGEKELPIPKLGEIAVEKRIIQQKVVDAVVKKQNDLKQNKANAQQTIRVNARKLGNLVDLVGELVIGSANCELTASKMKNPDLDEAMENLLRLIEEVRDTALGLRMVQIGETFNRYKRVVRDVGRETGKEIDLHINGAETELDKTLIEKIADPLMHLVRNAIDHGIESPEERQERGKPLKGNVSLDAFHDSGSIVIQIKDDGGGLSKEKILKKALENGLIQEDQQLSEHEIHRLIFEAGFSTAEKVSNLSGRGVGMDVVRRNIESLRGQVDIESTEGEGSIISIRLPLTLAIIDGFQVRVGDAQYIVPLNMIDECIELDDSLRHKDEQANYVNLRGEILPFMYLSDVFGYEGNKKGKHRDNIVVVQFAGKKAGFVVDELLGENQTVIKPLGQVFQNLKGISGATILGSGEVAMIIDIPEMIKYVENSGAQHQAAAHSIH